MLSQCWTWLYSPLRDNVKACLLFHKCPARSHRGWLHILPHLVQFPLTHCTWLPLLEKVIGSSIQFIGIVCVCWFAVSYIFGPKCLHLLSGEFPRCTWWIQEAWVVLLCGCGRLSDCCSQNSFPHPEKIKDMRRTDLWTSQLHLSEWRIPCAELCHLSKQKLLKWTTWSHPHWAKCCEPSVYWMLWE